MIESTIKKMLAKQFGVEIEDIKPNTHIINDMNADSVDVVELMMDLEIEFGIKLPQEEYENKYTTQELFDLVNNQLQSKGA